ncbi:hypothetical protein M2140_000170 [Clostridiales Family XIII bacterium PM5-7]
MGATYTNLNELTITFEDDNWKNDFTDIYVVDDSQFPWASTSATKYNGNNTLRSGVIGNSGFSEIMITFELKESGSIEFNYMVSSESRYDLMYVYLDGVSIFSDSGERAWTVKTADLVAGGHMIKIRYQKDGSGSSGSDMAAIGYIKLTGVEPCGEKYHMLYDIETEKYLTVQNGELQELSITSPTISDFATYGTGEIPSDELLSTLRYYKVLSAVNNPACGNLVGFESATVKGRVKDVFVMRNPFVLDSSYQTGFKSLAFNMTKATSTVAKAVISTDGETWYTRSGSSWVTIDNLYDNILSNGIEISQVASITSAQFDDLYSGIEEKKMHIAFVVETTTGDSWALKSIKATYNTGGVS